MNTNTILNMATHTNIGTRMRTAIASITITTNMLSARNMRMHRA
ncbi:hypothetical protein MKFW12EY_38130 [Methylomonas koyamae]|nr:hypothetical protein MKFW12EY_38130 [Methylomonas koyamae]